MPIYEYHCNHCSHEFEKLVFKSSEIIPCPKCKSRKVKRMMSACSFSVSGKPANTASSSCSSCSSSNCSSCGSKS